MNTTMIIFVISLPHAITKERRMLLEYYYDIPLIYSNCIISQQKEVELDEGKQVSQKRRKTIIELEEDQKQQIQLSPGDNLGLKHIIRTNLYEKFISCKILTLKQSNLEGQLFYLDRDKYIRVLLNNRIQTSSQNNGAEQSLQKIVKRKQDRNTLD
ncbi:unnamed protein product (macronuclear) [Paramecium tetraurelia]|uniref:Uncharacterized protein n=1 Tax=Paramecium tetraurelia TaxID=5888 RepID=A0BBH9_PARTE|nr:uncharacterized protein GSPATT00000331001 [Paramecium tetraurelia]CAK55896.1 unnamed protein product [Paramecium tetraurelia]|eukprot:XP_001423294.1 hypothetical protein (macronuclear) [Paramecium tetraurelia strain d4-2]